MNKHIEIVKKWLKDNDSVSLEELEANKKTADAAYYTAAYADYAAADAAAKAAAAEAAYLACAYAADAYAAKAAYWVKRYEGLTK